MAKEHELATDAEVLEELDKIRKEREDDSKKALADKASAEIMASYGKKLLTDPKGNPILPPGWHPFPSNTPDMLMLAVQEVVGGLERSRIDRPHRDRDEFESEMIERMAESGILVRVQWYHSGGDGEMTPELEMLAVDERWSWAIAGHKDYDPDRQVFDVVNDTLGTGKKGTIGGSFNPFGR